MSLFDNSQVKQAKRFLFGASFQTLVFPCSREKLQIYLFLHSNRKNFTFPISMRMSPPIILVQFQPTSLFSTLILFLVFLIRLFSLEGQFIRPTRTILHYFAIFKTEGNRFLKHSISIHPLFLYTKPSQQTYHRKKPQFPARNPPQSHFITRTSRERKKITQNHSHSNNYHGIVLRQETRSKKKITPISRKSTTPTWKNAPLVVQFGR